MDVDNFSLLVTEYKFILLLQPMRNKQNTNFLYPAQCAVQRYIKLINQGQYDSDQEYTYSHMRKNNQNFYFCDHVKNGHFKAKTAKFMNSLPLSSSPLVHALVLKSLTVKITTTIVIINTENII